MTSDDAPDRVALVTGTTRGLGLEVARALLARGWTVAGVARGAAPDTLRGPRYLHGRVDLSDVGALASWCAGPLAAQLPLDAAGTLAVVNNAGRLGPVAPLHRTEPEDLAATLAIDVGAPAWLMGWARRHAAGRRVRVVDVSSGAAHSAYPGWGAYCASKAALHMLGRVLAVEAAEVPQPVATDLAVLSFAPGVLATEMQAEIRAADAADFPRRPRFLALHEEGELLDPTLPAARIVEWLETVQVEPWAEERFTPPG